MFRFIDKDIFDSAAIYTFDVLDPTYTVVGKMIITVGSGRHDASLVFNRDKISGPLLAYEYIETARELLDADLILIEEEHNRIILAEIVYESSMYLF